MRFVHRSEGEPRRLGVLAGSFNPPTRAHVGLVHASARHVDEVLCVVPRVFPHKIYHGASLDERIEMLKAIRPGGLAYSIGVTDGGLFVDIARECREAYGSSSLDIWFLCGRDAAERIIEWDYGEPGAIDRMLGDFGLLVAPRHGHYEPPPHLAHRVANLDVPEELNDISSTEIRDRIRKGEPWQHLAPPALHDAIHQVYRGGGKRNP